MAIESSFLKYEDNLQGISQENDENLNLKHLNQPQRSLESEIRNPKKKDTTSSWWFLLVSLLVSFLLLFGLVAGLLLFVKW